MIFDKIRSLFDGESREDTLSYMPKRRYDDWLPTMKFHQRVTTNGQVRIPADVWHEENEGMGTGVYPGQEYHVHAFPADYSDARGNNVRAVRFDGSVTKARYITIPKEDREMYDIRPGDTVAIHMYWKWPDDEEDNA